jgi:hypothetical protein
MERVGTWVEQKWTNFSNTKLLKQLKSGEKILNVSLRQFKLLLNRIFLFEVTVSLVSDPNPGNFLALLKYLETFDLVVREHSDSVSGKPGCLSYSSPDIQNEFITLLGARVRQTITSSIQKAKYYSIIFDTTPDNAHIEQMSQIVRFVDIQRDSVEIKIAFIDFIPLDLKTAEIMTAEITKKLERAGLNLEDCRGQSYDNQATNGWQSFWRSKTNFRSESIGSFCSLQQSLSQFGWCSCCSCECPGTGFFGTVERLFGYFSCSTHRWSVLKDCQYYSEAPF